MIGTDDIEPATGQDATGARSDDVGASASQGGPADTSGPTVSAPPGPPAATVRGGPAASPEPMAKAPPGPRALAAPRHSRVVIRRLEPWSVFKFSLLFYFCLMLIVMFALMILFWIMGLTGVLDSAGHILQNAAFGPPPGKGTFRFNGVWIFQRLFAIGAVGVVVWSLVNLFVALLYNLVADVVGGISVTLAEKR
jgi:hypothetical protein